MCRITPLLLAIVLIGCGSAGDTATPAGASSADGPSAANTVLTDDTASPPTTAWDLGDPLPETCEELFDVGNSTDDEHAQFYIWLAVGEEGCRTGDLISAPADMVETIIPDPELTLPTDCDDLARATFAAAESGWRYQARYAIETIGTEYFVAPGYPEVSQDKPWMHKYIGWNKRDAAEAATPEQFRHLTTAVVDTWLAVERAADRWVESGCDDSIDFELWGPREYIITQMETYAHSNFPGIMREHMDELAAQAGLYCTENVKAEVPGCFERQDR